jgi:hypothetical protein
MEKKIEKLRSKKWSISKLLLMIQNKKKLHLDRIGLTKYLSVSIKNLVYYGYLFQGTDSLIKYVYYTLHHIF